METIIEFERDEEREKRMARRRADGWKVTKKGGTITTRGWIPHLKVGKINMPVRVKLSKSFNNAHMPKPPVLKNGCLVFVTPGGGDYIDNRLPKSVYQ